MRQGTGRGKVGPILRVAEIVLSKALSPLKAREIVERGTWNRAGSLRRPCAGPHTREVDASSEAERLSQELGLEVKLMAKALNLRPRLKTEKQAESKGK
jgi:hypothetical protein